MNFFFKKQSKKSLEQKMQKEKKSDKLYVKWKSHGNLFNSWIDKKSRK